MIKTVLAIFSVVCMLFGHVGTSRAASCNIGSKGTAGETATVADCCKKEMKADTGSHSEHQKKNEKPSKDRCADCAYCKVLTAPSVVILDPNGLIALTDGTVLPAAEEHLLSGGLALPATPPPRA